MDAPGPPRAHVVAAAAGALAIAAVVFGPHLGGDPFGTTPRSSRRTPTSCKNAASGTCSRAHRARRLGLPAALHGHLWAQARVAGIGVPGMRAVNVAIHAAVAVALAVLMRRLGVGALAALAGPAIFLVHPSVTEPVMWLDGRHDTLGALFAIGALLLWIPRDGEASPRRRAFAALLTAAAVLCKEVFVVVPLLLALDEARRAVDGGRRPATAELAWLAAPAAAVAACFGIRSALGIPGTPSGLSAGELMRAWGTLLERDALQLLALGNGPTVETYVPLGTAHAAGVVVALAAVLAGLAHLARRGSRRAGIAALGIAWFALPLAPAAVAVAIAGQHANRYVYFPWAGLALALAPGLDRLAALLASPRARLAAAGAGVLPGLAVRTSEEAARWHDEASLFGADVARLPGDGRASSTSRPTCSAGSGRPAALPMFARASELSPGYVRAFHNVAGCLLRAGRFADAVPPARRAVKLDPDNPRRRYNLGLALAGAGDTGAARAELERAVALDPGYAAARRELEVSAGRPEDEEDGREAQDHERPASRRRVPLLL